MVHFTRIGEQIMITYGIRMKILLIKRKQTFQFWMQRYEYYLHV